MQQVTFPNKPNYSLFSQVLVEKRTKAGLSLSDLADLSRLPLSLLEDLESTGRSVPSFDICYKIGQAINSRRMQGFMIQDLWEAATIDRTARFIRASYATPSPAPAMQRKAA
ncbi:MAG TPA: helix-turn-helix transcriptional regulator [Blastocatellia bacterium]|nr:helix-turn-helix transcriptional regulator [Blastocatellia bacterium]